MTGTASATSGGGGGVRDLVGIGVAVRVLANEGAGRGLRRSRSSSELLARAEELGGEPYDGNGGRRSSACERASYGGGGDARGEGKGGRSSPWGHTVARWVTRSSSGVDSGRRRSSEPRAKARSWRCGGVARSGRLGGADVEVEAAPGGTSERAGDSGGREINQRTATVALGRSERVRERGKVDLGEERRKWEWGADEARRLGLIPSARAAGWRGGRAATARARASVG